MDIGNRLELFVDDCLVERTRGAERRLHHPTTREVVMVHDAPWEGSGCGYHTVFRDGDLYRMYHHAWDLRVVDGRLTEPHEFLTGYAESTDGIHWQKPELGLFEFAGSRKNNIVWRGVGTHNFCPFKDTNPDCAPDAAYKAVGGVGTEGLNAFKSPDGIHWSRMSETPIITQGAFDSQNLAFWDTVRGQYRCYLRDFRRASTRASNLTEPSPPGLRDIRTCTSQDFLTWTEPVWLEYPGAPAEQLYTNQIKPYYRAPHIFIGLPARYVERGWSPSMEALPDAEHRRGRATAEERYGTALTDALLMCSRDGITFQRWREAFLRPGVERTGSWAYGDNYIAWHVVETRPHLPGAPNELSLYATENYWVGPASRLRRYTLRLDGFVSVYAPARGGELVTKPLVFEGSELVLNFSTSAAGSLRVEVQHESGQPLAGRTAADCDEVFGDEIERVVTWKGGGRLDDLADRPVRLRFVMQDADLYSLRFRQTPSRS